MRRDADVFRVLNNLKKILSKFRCNYRLKVFVTFYSKNGVEIETEDTLPSAQFVNDVLKNVMVPGERMWILFFIPDNAESWKVWVPK